MDPIGLAVGMAVSACGSAEQAPLALIAVILGVIVLTGVFMRIAMKSY